MYYYICSGQSIYIDELPSFDSLKMGGARFTAEDLRVLHEACKKGNVDEGKVKISPSILETNSVVTGRTVSGARRQPDYTLHFLLLIAARI